MIVNSSGALEVIKHMGTEEDMKLKKEIGEIKENLKEKEEEMEALEDFNRALVVKKRGSNDGLREARKESVNTIGSGNTSLTDLPQDILVKTLNLPIKSLVSAMGVSKQWKNNHIPMSDPAGVWWIHSGLHEKAVWKEGDGWLFRIDFYMLHHRLTEENPSICKRYDDDCVNCGLTFASSCKGLLLYRFCRTYIVLSPFRQEALITPAIEHPSNERYLYSLSCGIGVTVENKAKLICICNHTHKACLKTIAWVFSIGEDEEWRAISCPDFQIEEIVRPVCDNGRQVYWVSAQSKFLAFDLLEDKFAIGSSIPRGVLVDFGGVVGLTDLNGWYASGHELNLYVEGEHNLKIFKGKGYDDNGVIIEWRQDVVVDMRAPLHGKRKVLGVDVDGNIIIQNGPRNITSYNTVNGILQDLIYPEWEEGLSFTFDVNFIYKGGLIPLCPHAHSLRVPDVLVPYIEGDQD